MGGLEQKGVIKSSAIQASDNVPGNPRFENPMRDIF